MKILPFTLKTLGLLAALGTIAAPSIGSSRRMVEVEVTLENLAPDNGTYLTPPLIAFHDGSTDIFDRGSPASEALERIAEDGNAAPLAESFANGQTVVLNDIGPIAPGMKVTRRIMLPERSLTNRYVSFASMVIPSNDAFVANSDPWPIHWCVATGPSKRRRSTFQAPRSTTLARSKTTKLLRIQHFWNRQPPIPANPKTAWSPCILDSTCRVPEAFSMSSSSVRADFTASGYQIALLTISPVAPEPVDVTIEITNSAPTNGNFLTPVWLGVHNGQFDFFDTGSAATPALERMAEDGDNSMLQNVFDASEYGSTQTVVTSGNEAPVFAPGDSATVTLTINSNSPNAQYLSYASMIIPSNDAFIGNNNPRQIPLFDESGDLRTDIHIHLGANVYDAGTETNDEIPENTAFLAQAAPNTGTSENSMITRHPGFNAKGSGGILDMEMFAAADFTAEGYTVASIGFPEPDPEDLRIDFVEVSDASTLLTWSGGSAPYAVEASTTLLPDSWQEIQMTSERNARIVRSEDSKVFLLSSAPCRTCTANGKI